MNSEHFEFPPKSFVRTLKMDEQFVINNQIKPERHVSISLKVDYLFVSNDVKAGSFYLFGVAMQAHVPQHHDCTEQQGGGVGHVFSCYVWGRSMNLTGEINQKHSLCLTFV